MKVIFSEIAWDQYTSWISGDKDVLRRINELIKDIQRQGLHTGIGKPEPLKGRKEWSRRITQTHRLVYTLDSEKNLVIVSCSGHYKD